MPNILDLLQAAGGIPQTQTPTLGGGELTPADLINPALARNLNGDTTGPDVVVPAKKPRVLREDPRDPDAANNAQADATQELIKRHGLFGLKGTLRDVVGTIGDAFLVQSGHKAVYQPRRQQEKLADAMYGYNDDPKAAAERVGMIDPEMGYGMSKDVDNREIQRSRYAQEQAIQQAQIDAKGRDILARYTDPSVIKDDVAYQRIKPSLQKIVSKYGLDDVILPDTYNPDDIAAMHRRGLSTDQSADNDRADESADSQNQYRQGQLGVARQRVQAAREAAAARTAETRRHNQRVETQGDERLRQGQERIDKPTTGKKTGLSALGIDLSKLPPPPGGGTIRKLK